MAIATLGYRVDSSQVALAERRLEGMSGAAGVAVGAARNLALQFGGFVAVVGSLRGALNLSQSFQNLTNGLRGMGLSADEAAQTLRSVGEVANRTRAPLEATAQLYRRVSVAGKDLGASSSDVLQFTENIGLALASAGVGANEASGALLQLSQAMAGGVVRAEEFNSILEGAFPIAQAAANGIDAAGGSVGRLRQLVIEGSISSKEFFDAILSQTGELRQAFDNTTPTISQAFTVLRNNLMQSIGEFDQATGASAAFAGAVLGLANGLDQVAGFAIAGGIAAATAYAPAIITATASTMAWVAALVTLRGAIVATGFGIFIVGAGMLINELLALVEATGSWGAALDLLGQVAKGVWKGIQTSAEAISPALSAVWADMEASFLFAISNMASGFSSFMQNFTSLSALPDFGITAPFKALGDAANAVTGSIDDLSGSAMAAAARADGLRVRAGQLATQGFDAARVALDKLNVVVEENSEGTKTAEQTAQELAASMAAVEGAAGGNSGGGAAGAVNGLTDELSEAESAGKKFADSMAGHFDGLITGGKSFGDVLQGIAGQLESQLWQNLFSGGIGAAPAGGGGGIGGWLAGIGTSIGNSLGSMFSFDGGGYTGAGPRSGGVDGRGGFPAILHPNETVVDHTRGQALGNNVTNITINTPPGMTARTQERDVNGVREVLIELKQAVADDIRRNGTVGQAMTQTFGLGRALGT